MPELNLEELTFDMLKVLPLKDLLSLQEKLNEAVEVRRDTEKNELLEKMTLLASDSGYSLDELLGDKPKKSVKIRYRNPDNFSDTWTGRGRKPKWVEALLESGKTLEDIEIK
jgi:DNA-binding protein H-NS